MIEYVVCKKIMDFPIKGEWFGRIMDGTKPEEYREIKPFWTKRLRNAGLLDEEGQPIPGRIGQAIFHAGYRPESRRAFVWFLLRIGQGRPEWGAEPGREYYILSIILKGAV